MVQKKRGRIERVLLEGMLGSFRRIQNQIYTHFLPETTFGIRPTGASQVPGHLHSGEREEIVGLSF